MASQFSFESKLRILDQTIPERQIPASFILSFIFLFFSFLVFAWSSALPRASFAGIPTTLKQSLAEKILRERRIPPQTLVDLWNQIARDLKAEGLNPNLDLASQSFDNDLIYLANTILKHYPHHLTSDFPSVLRHNVQRKTQSQYWMSFFDRLSDEISDLETLLWEQEIRSESLLAENRNRARFQQRIDQLGARSLSMSNPAESQSETDSTLSQKSSFFGHRYLLGLAETRGRRDSMEDRTIHHWFQGPTPGDNPLTEKGIKEFGIVGIFDGHGGSSIVNQAAKSSPKIITEFLLRLNPQELQDPEKIRITLEAAFDLESLEPTERSRFEGLVDLNSVLKTQWDQTVFSLDKVRLMYSRQRAIGSTAVIAVFLNTQVFLVNLGDSRALVLQQDGSYERLTRDHRPAEEATTLQEKGGTILYASTARLNKQLAMSRALGDWEFPIIRRPEVTLIDFQKEKSLALILQSDGVHEMNPSDREQGEMIFRQIPTCPPDEIAAAILQKAYQAGSEDNISVAVVTPLPFQVRIPSPKAEKFDFPDAMTGAAK
jgi:serine/threonine protein phosphatase PrpC